MEIAHFKQADYEAVLRLRDETYGSIDLASRFPWQPCQQVESLEKDCFRVVCKDEAVKGYASAYRLDETHFRLNLLVDPRHTGQGIGTLLLQTIEGEVRKAGGRYLQARLLENTGASLKFALARGFAEIHRMRGMTLRAGDFDYAKWEGLGKKFQAMAFSLTTLKDELGAGNDPIARLAELQDQARRGWLSPDPTQSGGMVTIDDFRKFFTNIEEPERLIIARFRDSYVGYTSVRSGPGTAVHAGYRNLGIAKYMKARAIRMCIDDGQERFETCSANPLMQRVNERLGYQFNGVSEVRLVKDLEADPASDNSDDHG
ncbi:MAG TPA: GNAT family N-acetyltransferase [Blastocatellia bacterium]|nr:GNAT family N-acetyltransferase [Blastocatellia bacterium]